MRDCLFPTIDPENPYQLTEEEEEIVQKLHKSFTGSEKLRKHMKCIFRYGCMYNVCNSNLLFHASMPMNADGTLKEVDILGKKYKGEALLKRVGQLIRTAYLQKKITRKKHLPETSSGTCGAERTLLPSIRVRWLPSSVIS